MESQASAANSSSKPSAGTIQWLKFLIACVVFIVPLGCIEVFSGTSLKTHMSNMYGDCKFVPSEQVRGCQHGVQMSMIGINLTVYMMIIASILIVILVMAQNFLRAFDDLATYKRYRMTLWGIGLAGFVGVIYFAS
jgi:hypothetical protein